MHRRGRPLRWGLDCWRSSPEEAEQAPPWASELCGLRFGFGFGPPPAPQGRGAARIAEPSLDRAFAARCGEHLLVGVANGHGHPRHAANLAELIAERLPEAVFQSPPLAQQGDAAGALIWAFHRVHREAAEALSLELAGAACTVALLDRERVWVAHVGDCRALLATPDPQPNAAQFHFVGSVLTQDAPRPYAHAAQEEVAWGGRWRPHARPSCLLRCGDLGEGAPSRGSQSRLGDRRGGAAPCGR